MGAGGLAGVLVANGASAEVGMAVPSSSGSEIPLHVGQRFARWTITAIAPIEDGAINVSVKGADDHEFVLQILAKDASPLATQPPATTEGLAIFVRNGGDGWLPTAEEQGLAAMTLAQVIVASGNGGCPEGLMTHADRIVRHRDMLLGDQRHLRRR
jgi:hypothetical protein